VDIDTSRAAPEHVAAAIAEHLRGRTVACAESCTAGRISEIFASVEGATDWFRGGVVAYQVQIKRSLLDVESPSVLCEQAAAEMAVGVARLLDADVTIATTGVAGDEPEEGVEPGTVFIVTYVDGDLHVDASRFLGDPMTVCASARDYALVSLRHHLDRNAATRKNG
jgi:nicotinamide-nucleotide amidase